MSSVAIPPILIHEMVRAQDLGQIDPWWRKEFGLGGERAEGVRVGIVDTGADQIHATAGDLKGVYKAHKDFSRSPSHYDMFGHGTHVAGIIAALDNEAGILGGAPLARLWNAKALGDDGGGSDLSVAAAIRWCVDEGCQIINCSLGSNSYSQAIANEVDYAISKDVLVIAASGNEGSKTAAAPDTESKDTVKPMAVSYPADHPGTIAVGAINRERRIAPFSNRGVKVQCVGPGVEIMSTYRNGGYGSLSGTSMATPWVSAVFALAIKANGGKNLSVDTAKKLLETCCDDLGTAGRDIEFGFGLPVVSRILAALAPPPAAPGPPPVLPPGAVVAMPVTGTFTAISHEGQRGLFLPTA